MLVVLFSPSLNATGVNPQSHKQQMHHFISVQLRISEICRSQRLMRIIPCCTSSQVQMVILWKDGDAHILKDSHSHASGIIRAEFQASCGSSSAGMVARVCLEI